MSAPEQRTVDVDVTDLDTRGRTLHGYASVYGVESRDLGGFRERIAPGAFASVLDADVRCLLNHDPSQVLGRTRAGTLRLHDEERGLRFECDLPQSPLGENVRESVRRGDTDGASFRFQVGEEEWDGELRTVRTVKALHDVTVATYGAYPTASVELRTRPQNPEREERMNDRESGGLAVEDRAATAAEPSVEERVTSALASVGKGETRSLTLASADPIAPPDLSSYLFDRLRAQSVALRSGVRVIVTDRESITWPQVTGDPVPGWYAEMDVITASDPTFTSLSVTPRKLAVRTEFANELLEDSEPDAGEVVRNLMVGGLADRLDFAFFEGSGAANQPRGLRLTPGIGSVVMGANGAAIANLDPIADAIALLEGANVPGPYVAVMNPRTWSTIRKLREATGSNKPLVADPPTSDALPSVFGVPVYTTTNLPVNEAQGTASNASSVYVHSTDPDKGPAIVRRRDAEILLDRSRLFDRDASEMRGTLRATLVVPQPSAVVRIVGVTP